MELIRKPLIKKSLDQGAPALHKNPPDAAGGKFVQEMPQAAATRSRRQGQILDAAQGCWIASDRAEGWLAGHGLPDPCPGRNLPSIVQDHPVEGPVRRRRPGPAVGKLGVVHFGRVPTHDDGFRSAPQSMSQPLHIWWGYLGHLADRPEPAI